MDMKSLEETILITSSILFLWKERGTKRLIFLEWEITIYFFSFSFGWNSSFIYNYCSVDQMFELVCWVREYTNIDVQTSLHKNSVYRFSIYLIIIFRNNSVLKIAVVINNFIS